MALILPAHAADTLGETATFHAPDEWHERIAALAPYLAYGPDYSRTILSHLGRMSEAVTDGYTAHAYDWLQAAETYAALIEARRR
jgi:hypothetical protein